MDTMTEDMLLIQLQLWQQLDQFIEDTMEKKDLLNGDDCKIISLHHDIPVKKEKANGQ
jgi:hypothetical protein